MPIGYVKYRVPNRLFWPFKESVIFYMFFGIEAIEKAKAKSE